MEESQNQNQEEQQEQQPEVVIEQPKKNIIPTRLGSLIILLTAVIAGAGVWWYSFSYEEPVPMDVGQVVRELQARRMVAEEESKVPSDYEVEIDGVYYKFVLIEEADWEQLESLAYDYCKDKEKVYYCGVGGGYGLELKDADPETFRILTRSITRDHNNLYLWGRLVKVEGLDAKDDFRLIYSPGQAYFAGQGPNYTPRCVESKESVYCHFRILYEENGGYDTRFGFIEVIGANLKTFEFVSETTESIGEYVETIIWHKDKYNVYKNGEKVKGVDPANCTAENLDGCEAPTE